MCTSFCFFFKYKRCNIKDVCYCVNMCEKLEKGKQKKKKLNKN